MSTMDREHIILTALLAVGLSACGSTTSEAPAPAPASQTTLSQPTKAAIDEALAEYETVRAKLAADETSGLADAAKRIASAAARAAETAPERLHPFLQSLAEQSTKLAATSTDIEQIRVAFGEVSRAVVGLIAADTRLQKGRFVFRCPMATGYKKWVQIDAKLENPFMGKKMLECGTRSDWEV